MKTKILFLLSLLCLVSAVFATNSVTPETNIDSRWYRSWPAGPYSEVATGHGVLQTNIQLFSLEGAGNTSIGYSIYHSSFIGNMGQWGLSDGGVGHGWLQGIINSVGPGSNGTTNYVAGNHSSAWMYQGGTNSYVRNPGTRADLTRLMSGTSVTGFQVVQQADKSTWTYQEPVAAQSEYRLTQMTDTRGNTISYQYDSYHRPTRRGLANIFTTAIR